MAFRTAAPPVNDREFVEPGSEPSPLLQVTDSSLDDVPTAIFVCVEPWRTTAREASPPPVSSLVPGLWNHSLDAAATWQLAVRFRGIRLVIADRFRSSATLTSTWSETRDVPVLKQDREHGRATRLTRIHEHDQRKPAPINELVELRTQTPTRPANPVVSGLERILVIRKIPL